MRSTVSFTRMEDGTREDYELLDRSELEYARHLPDSILEAWENSTTRLRAIP